MDQPLPEQMSIWTASVEIGKRRGTYWQNHRWQSAKLQIKNALELGGISVKVDIKSLTKDVIIIESVEVNKPVINYELLSLTQNNLSQLLENIKKYRLS